MCHVRSTAEQAIIDSGLVRWGTMRAGNAQGAPTLSHISPSILVYEDQASIPVDMEQTELSHSKSFKVVLQKSMSTQICQLILHISNSKG